MESKFMFKIAFFGILMPLYITCNVEESTYQANGLVCDKCPPGTHWRANCRKEDRRSECRNCPHGSFSETENTATSCEKCLQEGECHPGTVFINTCSPTTNNRCECPDGQYWHPIHGYDGRCYKHRTCNDGEVVVKKGTASKNTECGPKPADPTSNGENEKDHNGNHHTRAEANGENENDHNDNCHPGAEDNDENGKDHNDNRHPGAEDNDENGKDHNDNRHPGAEDNGDARGRADRKLTVPKLFIMCLAVYSIYRVIKKYSPRLIHVHND